MISIRLLSVILMLLTGMHSVTAQSTVVEGHANRAEGYVIRLIKYKDLLTRLDSVLATDTVDKNGNFRLECNNDDITYAFIDVEFQRAEIYLEPGRELKLEINFDPEQRQSLYFDRQPLEYAVTDALPSDLNSSIMEINRVYNDFILEYFNKIYRSRKKQLIDTLRLKMKNANGSATEYAANYINYKLASLEQAARIVSREALANKYLEGEELLYGNVEYMYFFEEFFDKYLLNSTGELNLSVILTMFAGNKSIEEFIKVAGNDPFLSGRRTTEFFLLSNFKSLYGHPDIPRTQIISLVTELGSVTQYVEHQKIAKNLVEKFTRLSPGTQAPAFTLPAYGGQMVSLKDFRGKYLYLGFFLSENPTCILELDLLAKLIGGFVNNLEALMISADKKEEEAYRLAFEKDYPWMTLHYDDDISLLEEYDATTFPLFILISPEGEIVSYPAPRPSEDLETLILRCVK